MSLSIQFYLRSSGQEDSSLAVASRSQTQGNFALIKARVLSLMHPNYSWIELNVPFNVTSVFLFAVQEMEERIRHFETFL